MLLWLVITRVAIVTTRVAIVTTRVTIATTRVTIATTLRYLIKIKCVLKFEINRKSVLCKHMIITLRGGGRGAGSGDHGNTCCHGNTCYHVTLPAT